MGSPVERIFDKAFTHIDELETIIQYLKSERQHVDMAILPESKFRTGWKQLVKLYNSSDGHCLKEGCGKATLQYWANQVPGGMDESKWFWRTVLVIAVKRNLAVESINHSNCRKYKFN